MFYNFHYIFIQKSFRLFTPFKLGVLNYSYAHRSSEATGLPDPK
uniref:Uncharacterized protein n=1 Tax=viral metagenome TaxID=1070528 RepID=A0A6C0HQR6_9ZZZZ